MPRFPSVRAARGVCAHAVAGTALQNVLPLRVRRPPRGFSLRVFPRCFHPVLVRDPRVSIWQLPFSPFSSALRECVRFAPLSLFPPALTSARSRTSRRRRCALAGATRTRIPRERSASAGLECAARIRARDTGREAERADDGSGALQRQRRAVGKGRSGAQRAGGIPLG